MKSLRKFITEESKTARNKSSKSLAESTMVHKYMTVGQSEEARKFKGAFAPNTFSKREYDSLVKDFYKNGVKEVAVIHISEMSSADFSKFMTLLVDKNNKDAIEYVEDQMDSGLAREFSRTKVSGHIIYELEFD